ncbi:MAG: PQQ-binding-like beta-propeller repeat protein, partial [Planctomycetaceae bacterium]
MRLLPVAAVLLGCGLFSFDGAVHAGDWPAWRGPGGAGLAEGTGYPQQWSADRGVMWKVPLTIRGASTPAVIGDRIFLTGTRDSSNVVQCFSRAGSLRWERVLGTSVEGKPGKDGTGANPSPTTDGRYVFVYFKSGDLACFTVKEHRQRPPPPHCPSAQGMSRDPTTKCPARTSAADCAATAADPR